MTKEELEKEAEEKYVEVDREFIACQDEGEVFNIGYVLAAEPREKQITGLSKHILELQKDKGNLIDRVRELEQQIEKMQCWHNMDYNDKESCKKIPRGIQLLTEYDCGLFVAYCVNKWTGDHWVEHNYGITRWKEIEAK